MNYDLLMNSNAEVRMALDAFRRIVQALRTGGSDGRARARISHAQRFALQQIANHPRASINDVAALTFTHQSSVSVVVQRLVARRLVAKVAASDDRRRQRLVITARGRRVLARAPAAAVPERLVTAISSLPSSGRRAFVRALHRIAGEVAPAGPPPMFLEGLTKRKRRRS
jgi:DNA-binding MarR family transcriptional regulator